MCDRRRNLQSIARDVSISFSSGNSDWCLWHVKVFRQMMGPQTVDWRPETDQTWHCMISFVSLRGWTWFYLPDRKLGWNMSPSLRSRILKIGHAVEAYWLTPSEGMARLYNSLTDYWTIQQLSFLSILYKYNNQEDLTLIRISSRKS
jgi:hypothetical protein